MKIGFDSQVYINEKALTYITQEYNEIKGVRGSLNNYDRLLYLADCGDDYCEVIKKIIDEIVNFFNLESNIDIFKPIIQKRKEPIS